MKLHPARSHMRFIVVVLALAGIFAAGCGRKKKQAHVPSTPRVKMVETGIASWYGYPYHGRRAANGEIYDMEKMTAAHRTLPFDTWVAVDNLDNGRTVTVRITDRGPFVNGRIIDISKAAAREIEMIGPGIAKVRVRVVTPPPESAGVSRFAVQAGAFEDQGRAESLRRRFESEYGSARLVLRPGRPSVWRVLVGNEPTLDAAGALLARITGSGQDAFIVRLDEAPGAR
jgi:rare lipoprotein A